MSDQRVILDELARAAARGETTVLASIVRTVGSAYRGVGARMLVRADDTTVGLVSGGCLEADLVGHARRVRATHEHALVTYDTHLHDDLLWGLGLGCNGLLEVLLEALPPARAEGVAGLLRRSVDADAPSVIATVIRSGGAGAPGVGARVLIDAAASHVVRDGDWGDGRILSLVIADAQGDAGRARHGATRDYGVASAEASATHASASVQVAFELAIPPVQLVMCGSGPDAAPVARLAVGLGWDVTVVDHRPVSLAHPERFPGARVVECADAARLADVVALRGRTMAVAMSHHFQRDLDYLEALLGARVGYLGLLGPRARTDRLLADLAARGCRCSESARDRLYGPVGLDVGGDGPEAIALAIVAEISAVASGRAGGHLRDRHAPIHAAPAATDVDSGMRDAERHEPARVA